MSNWKNLELFKAIQFNPPERITKGEIAKKIAMEKLTPFEKKIKGFEFAEYSAGPKFRNGDTLVAKITPCLENGKTAQVDVLENNEVAFGSSEFIVLRHNEKTISDFIFYLAKSPAFRKKAIGCMEGTSGRKRVNEGALKMQVLPIPDISTQQKIASVLSSLDSKIELNNRINSELEAMAKTLYDYWFVQFDFPDTNGKPYKTNGGVMVWNKELKREIPQRWKVKSLDNAISEFTKGITTKYVEKSALINLNQKVNRGFILERQYLKYLDESIKIPESKYAKEKDILINSLGQGTLGRIHFFCEKTNKIVVDQHLFILRTNIQKTTPTFLYHLLSSSAYKLQIERQITGSTGMQMLNASNLKDIQIILPELNITELFEKKVYPFYGKVANNSIQNQQLSELRDWLLPMLMNGQVKVGYITTENATYEQEEVVRMAAEPNQ